jgi:hypothetical protein
VERPTFAAASRHSDDALTSAEEVGVTTTRTAFFLGASLMTFAAADAAALQLVGLTPQGEVSRVRQVVAKFDGAAVNFGDPKAPAPFTVSCDDARAGKGTARWTGERQWVFDFEDDLPPGIRCTVDRMNGFRSPTGEEPKAPQRQTFTTGGPFVRNIRPGR